MEYREIAPGVEIPVLGFGTWGIGGREQPDYRRDEEEIMAIRLAIELGLTHIDTAEFYGAGHSEELVGQAVEGYERNKIFITTKVWHTHLRKDDVIKSINASLDRLRLDFVDLYLIHWPNLAIPLSETMAAMEECVSKGLTRFIGVSNFSAQLMLEAQKKLKNNKIITNQVEYSLLDQKPSMELLPTCRETGISLVAYRPIGRGNLAKPGNKILD
jgi:diketogulonate reductase-like aldo/keto reductase